MYHVIHIIFEKSCNFWITHVSIAVEQQLFKGVTKMETNPYEIFIPMVLFIVVAVITKIISDNKIKHKIIEMDSVNENLKYLNPLKFTVHPVVNLKWSFLSFAIGLPLLLKQFFPDIANEGIIGLMLIFSGIGFYLYYLMAKKELNNN